MTIKTNYVDGFVLIFPKDKVEEYKKVASDGRDMYEAWCACC